jgi:predicted Zn-dependent protease
MIRLKIALRTLGGWCALLAVAGGPVWAHPELERQIADATARIEAHPADPELRLKRGELHRLHRDWPAAEADYAAARRLDPNLAAVDLVLGTMLLEAGRAAEARVTLDRFLARVPRHATGLATRARAWVELGRPLAAAEDYTRALRSLGPDERALPDYYLERARALAAAGPRHLDQAIAGLDEGLAALGQPVTLQLLAIDLEVQRKRPDAALARLERVAAAASRQEAWLVRRGEILEQAGRAEEARTAYRSALEAIERLPPGRRTTRAVERLEAEARGALARLASAPAATGAP